MGETLSFASNSAATSGYLAIPQSGKGPGVVVLQEWWGLVGHIKDVCDRFAAEGFVALAPDIYHGKTTKSPDEAGKLMMALKIDEAEKDLRGAIEYVSSLPATTSKTIGTIGFCMGGALSLFAACKNEKVGACVVFYGIHPNVKPDLEKLQAPVLGIFGERDGFVTPEVARELERKLKAVGETVEIHIYPDADHAFFNDTRPEVYKADAAHDAWRRTIEFFRKHLK